MKGKFTHSAKQPGKLASFGLLFSLVAAVVIIGAGIISAYSPTVELPPLPTLAVLPPLPANSSVLRQSEDQHSANIGAAAPVIADQPVTTAQDAPAPEVAVSGNQEQAPALSASNQAVGDAEIAKAQPAPNTAAASDSNPVISINAAAAPAVNVQTIIHNPASTGEQQAAASSSPQRDTEAITNSNPYPNPSGASVSVALAAAPPLECPAGYTQIKIVTHNAVLTQQYNQRYTGQFWVAEDSPGGYLLVISQVGHPEAGCPDSGDPLCADQDGESFNIEVAGQTFFVPDHGNDRYEVFTFPLSLPRSMTQITFSHSLQAQNNEFGSVFFNAAYCASAVEPTPTEPTPTDPPPDSDGDGVIDDQDCAPLDPHIYPGAPEIPNDGIDQDCDGEDLIELGTGDVQVTLTWDNTDDMDLWVIEPNGTRIWYGDRGPTSTGGQLDVDGYAACGGVPIAVENIFWPTGQSPAGAYRAVVDEYMRCGNPSRARWRLVVRVNGVIVLDQTGIGGHHEFVFVVSGSTATVAHSAQITMMDSVKGAKISEPPPEAPSDTQPIEGEVALPDSDGDGVPDEADCAPYDSSIFPGGIEQADDGIDQDCSGADLITQSGAQIAVETPTTLPPAPTEPAPTEVMPTAPAEATEAPENTGG